MTGELSFRDIQSLGYETEEILPRVFKVRNFVTPDELKELFTEANSYSEEDWNYRYLAEMRLHAREKFGRDDLENLKAEGLLEITENFADKNISVANVQLMQTLHRRCEEIFNKVGGLDVTGFVVFQRLYAGTELISHFDKYSDKLVEYAAVLYLNNDYNGGELFFPKFDYEIKPEPGTLIIFPSTEQFEHGVRPVKEGPVRYVIPVFIKANHPDGSMAGWANFG